MWFVRVLCVLMIAVLAGVLSWEPMRDHLEADNGYVLLWGLIGAFLSGLCPLLHKADHHAAEKSGSDLLRPGPQE